MKIFFTAATAAFAGLLFAGGSAWSGSVSLETRVFGEQPTWSGQEDGLQSGLVFEPEFRWQDEAQRRQITIVPYLRSDGRDEERSHFDVREAYLRINRPDWALLTGIAKVFWGVAESRHLVDVINQDDAVEDIDGEDKLGQPMVSMQWVQSWGSLTAMLLPGFRERTFPGTNGRLRAPIPVNQIVSVYESAAGKHHLDAALRYSHYFGDWDVGISTFHGTSREPRLLPDAQGQSLIPHYDLMSRLGLDLQLTREATLWKFESVVQRQLDHNFLALVSGLEYTHYQLFGSAADLGLLVEYLYDARDPDFAAATLFDDDFFLGTRLALNDAQDTALLAGFIVDRHDHSTIASIEGSRRIGTRWVLELEGRFFLNIGPYNPQLYALRHDDLLTIRLNYHF